MNLRQIAGLGGSNATEKKPVELPNPERVLTLVVDGAALGVPEVDGGAYPEFRANVAKLALQLPDRLPEEEKLAQVRLVLREFQNYRKSSETELRNRTTEWRAVVSFLLRELLRSLGIDASAPNPSALLRKLAGVTSAQAIQEFHDRLEAFLHPDGAESAPVEASQFRTADHSTANHNAAGLRGGGSAIEHLKRILESGAKAFIVLFRLSCLNMINQRFGPEAVEDCLMAVVRISHPKPALRRRHLSLERLLAAGHLAGPRQRSDSYRGAEPYRQSESRDHREHRRPRYHVAHSHHLRPHTHRAAENCRRSLQNYLADHQRENAMKAKSRSASTAAARRPALHAARRPTLNIDHLPLPYVEMDARGIITRANRAALALHHPEQGDLIGRSGWDMMAIDEKDLQLRRLPFAHGVG